MNLREKYLLVRRKTQDICSSLLVEDMVIQPHNDVSPPKWHLAHTTWFFEEVILAKYTQNYKRFDESFNFLFNSYYKAAGEHWQHSQRGSISRPTCENIFSYRTMIDEKMEKLLSSKDLSEEVIQKIEIGLNHEQQHQELLYMDIKFILSLNPSKPYLDDLILKKLPPVSKQVEKWEGFDEGVFLIGGNTNEFTYDNELPRHKKFIYPFEIRVCAVTNGEYLDFINDGGYENAELWHSDGWDWLASAEKYPLYWQKRDGRWFEYHLSGETKLDITAPVAHINFFEASAYAKWSRARLPREEEMEIFLEKRNEGASALWSWCDTSYHAYPGYQSYTGLLSEYNSKFMSNQIVLRGGCQFTPKDHFRNSYRNFYRAHQKWMFSGIHLARDIT